jgi:hypothetical protein
MPLPRCVGADLAAPRAAILARLAQHFQMSHHSRAEASFLIPRAADFAGPLQQLQVASVGCTTANAIVQTAARRPGPPQETQVPASDGRNTEGANVIHPEVKKTGK